MPATAADPLNLARLPQGIAAWVFAARTFAAAMLALYIAFAAGLERPAWAMATVYIVSQPLSGAALAKGFYRILGTLVGGAFTLAAVPLLVTAPPLLTLLLALWIGGCLYLSLRDRSPRSYVFMLAGYSAAIIGFPNVGDPAGLFGIVVARVEEIGLGILCATTFSALILPQTAHAAGLARMRLWLRGADRQLAGLLRGSLVGQAAVRSERDLAAEITALQTLLIYLSYEPATSRSVRSIVRGMHGHAALMLRLLAEIRDRLAVLRADAPLDPALDVTLTRLAAWAEQGIASDPAEGASCAAALADHAEAARREGEGWRSATLVNLAHRLRRFIEVREDCRTLWQALEAEREPATLRVETLPPDVQLGAIDPGNALRAAVAVVLALCLTGAFWILAAWPDGAVAMMMVAISASVTAAQRQPMPALVEFLVAAVIALVFVFLYVFAILPLVRDFAGLCLVLFPALMGAGLLVANPRTVGVGFGIAVTFTTLLGLQNMFSGDLAAFANGNGAAVIGVCVALATVALVRPRSAEQAAARLIWHGWADVAALARQPEAEGCRRIVRRLVERLGLLATGRPPRRGDDGEVAFATLFAAEGVLGLAASHAGARFTRLTEAAGSYFRTLMDGGRPDATPLLGALDAARADAAAQSEDADVLSALVSLRRGVVLVEGEGR